MGFKTFYLSLKVVSGGWVVVGLVILLSTKVQIFRFGFKTFDLDLGLDNRGDETYHAESQITILCVCLSQEIRFCFTLLRCWEETQAEYRQSQNCQRFYSENPLSNNERFLFVSVSMTKPRFYMSNNK